MPKIVERETETISNVFLNFASQAVRDQWTKEAMGLYPLLREKGEKLVSYHRKHLGKSRICFGNRRYNTWDRPLWTAHVNNRYGVKLEVPDFPGWDKMDKMRGTPKVLPVIAKAVEAWRDYRAAIGLTSELMVES